MKPRIYVDGQAGTTGLMIHELLAGREDLTLLKIDEQRRKDPGARRELLTSADIAILCLPDDAAREAVQWVGSAPTRILDASTAHRIAEGWVYGLPELAPEQRARIAAAKLVANPGCYPTGIVLLLRPLVEAGLLPASAPVTIHALSGYSGGGRQMIERWEDPKTELLELVYESPYALDRQHKHIPEVVQHAGLEYAPHFVPAAGPFYAGMRIQIPLHRGMLRRDASAEAVWSALEQRYRGEAFVRVVPREASLGDERGLDPLRFNRTNVVELRVVENPLGHVLLLATLDNLGKGAAGAAVQNLNLMLGADEATGLARVPGETG